jgi:hypothetical protein
MTGETATHDMDSSFGEEFLTLSNTLVPLTVRQNLRRFVNRKDRVSSLYFKENYSLMLTEI